MEKSPESLGSVAHGGEDITAAFTSGERTSYVVDSSGHKFAIDIPQSIRTLTPLEQWKLSTEPATIINELDKRIQLLGNIQAIEKNKAVDKIYEEAIAYKQLRGTPEYDENKMKQYILDFAKAKADALPSMTWRESDALPMLAKEFGFRFRKI